MMRKELDDALCADFPLLYRDRHGDRAKTSMCYGFCCGDGWEPIIRKASLKLEEILASMPEEERVKHCAAQVKEKFAGLRFYLRYGTEEMNKITRELEDEASRICETCGAPGNPVSIKGYRRTACHEHSS